MKIKLFLLFNIALSFVTIPLFGQINDDMEMLKERAKEKVALLNEYISLIANPKDPLKNRVQYKEEAQSLFVNDCDSFKEISEYVGRLTKEVVKKEIMREGVTMEVTSINNPTPRQKLMKQYFRGLMNLYYRSVEIKTTDRADMRVSELKPYGKDENGKWLYTCTVYFDQKFIGIRGDGGEYMDLTHKWVVCYVRVDEVYEPETGETRPEYMVRLGDVHVSSTERIF